MDTVTNGISSILYALGMRPQAMMVPGLSRGTSSSLRGDENSNSTPTLRHSP